VGKLKVKRESKAYFYLRVLTNLTKVLQISIRRTPAADHENHGFLESCPYQLILLEEDN
jgi:hypothetical protein